MKTLVIDVGGTRVKFIASGMKTPVKFESGPTMTPSVMVETILSMTEGWRFDRISMGFPGPVRNGKLIQEPWNLGPGWVGFNFEKAFGKPIRIINDAAMQALGSYEGGAMLFLGLGTGLGSAIIKDDVLLPLELGHLPYRQGKTYEEYVGAVGMHKLGKKRWRRRVQDVLDRFIAAFEVDYVVLGGGNAKHVKDLPSNVRLGSNANAFKGGFRLWKS